ncbi:DUF2306 domain-containing protein [Simiduia litorea]|uniref:DUF2306 domain-containing protein n=1 Tax=Simiduia litorea TaxID=1435348 RepID=UPI0036F2CBE6
MLLDAVQNRNPAHRDVAVVGAPTLWQKKLLSFTGRAWFAVAFLGQWIFVAYVVLHYGGMLLENGLAGWSVESKNAYVAGDWLGNLSMLAHIVLAVVVLVGGSLQLMPVVRSRWPKFHRINGRVYILGAVITSIAGLILVWGRGTVGGDVMRWGISLNALLIIAFAGLAIYCAMQRRFAEHQRWALRLFMVVSAVWFFRITFMLWMILTGGAGINFDDFTGPFPYTLVFAQYFVPLLILELFQWVKVKGSAVAMHAMTGLVMLCIVLTTAGVGAATVAMWLPKVM